jgi:hypothetical protein
MMSGMRKPPPICAYLHQLSPRDDNLHTLGQGVENEKDGGGVVVDYQGGLGAGEQAEQIFQLFGPDAAFPGGQVVL